MGAVKSPFYNFRSDLLQAVHGDAVLIKPNEEIAVEKVFLFPTQENAGKAYAGHFVEVRVNGAVKASYSVRGLLGLGGAGFEPSSAILAGPSDTLTFHFPVPTELYFKAHTKMEIDWKAPEGPHS